jgi:hypothetical protein
MGAAATLQSRGRRLLRSDAVFVDGGQLDLRV